MLRAILLAVVVLAMLYGPRVVRRIARLQARDVVVGPENSPDCQDLSFHIVEIARPTADGRRLTIEAKYNPTIRMTLPLGTRWNESELGDPKIRAYIGSVTVAPELPSGDAFAPDLDVRYETRLAPKGTRA